jgi:thiamine-monophosphate kinase
VSRPSEDDLIARYFAPLAGVNGFGLRDDVAVATPRPGQDLIVTKDMLIAGVHFFTDDPAADIARKALRVNLSDLAAKGATPLGFLLGLGLPADWTEAWLADFASGLGADARRFACPLLGGDTVRAPTLTLSITAFGEVACGDLVLRTAARPGDEIFVSGTIGDAALGLRVRQKRPEDAAWIAALPEAAADHLRARYALPLPRLGLSEALRHHARAAMDVSDGLVGDLAKMLRPTGLSMTVATADVPLSEAARLAIEYRPALLSLALSGGDDYEVLCAVPSDQAASFEAAATAGGVPMARIGVLVPGQQPPSFFGPTGERLNFEQLSYSHF